MVNDVPGIHEMSRDTNRQSLTVTSNRKSKITITGTKFKI